METLFFRWHKIVADVQLFLVKYSYVIQGQYEKRLQ